MTDTELRALMVDTKKWPNVIASFKNGHRASGDLAQRAHVLFNQGAPVVDPKTKKIVRAR